ncbi:MAG: SDR family oxidoreductase [Myxococcota bacterium]|nr:SDR family oxidoreductase [Myxococcota bacterium]
MRTRIVGKRVLITGGASGIGLCAAEEFARAGAELVLTDVNIDGLAAAAEQLRGLGATVHTRVVDVSDRAAVNELARWVIDDLGGLDVLVNNAGIGHQGELAETSLETWDQLLAVNLMGPLNHVYAFLPYFKQRRAGQIVNVSSGQVFFRLPTWGAYAAIKAALGVFSEVAHFELRKYGIGVTTFYPFMVNTPFYDEVEGDTWGSRMSMKLLPLYSQKPEKVGRILFDAVRRRAKVETVSVINEVGFYAQFVPLANDVIARTSNFLLAKGAA